MQVHVCGACKGEFESEVAYVEHECEATGFTPKDKEHQEAMEAGEAT